MIKKNTSKYVNIPFYVAYLKILVLQGINIAENAKKLHRFNTFE